VEGEIGIGNRIPEECTIHDNHFCPPAERALTFLRQEKQAKVPALLPAFREILHVPPSSKANVCLHPTMRYF
ncbi:MAG: hypothetical protein WCQ55_04345, partial [Paludibacteraceae bacterium]